MKDRVPTSDLVLKITGTIVAVVVFALALTTLLNVLRLQQTSEDLLADRLSGIAGEVRSVAYRGLDVGLTLASMDNLPAILEAYATADPHIQSIAVHDCDGALVAHAPGQPRAGIESVWEKHLGVPKWSRIQPETASLGLELTDGLGLCAGGVVVTYDRNAQQANLGGAQRTLMVYTLLAGLAAVPAAMATSLLLARRRRGLMAVYSDLDALDKTEDGGPPTTTGTRAGARTGGDVAAAYWAARPTLADTLRATRHRTSPPEPPETTS